MLKDLRHSILMLLFAGVLEFQFAPWSITISLYLLVLLLVGSMLLYAKWAYDTWRRES